MSEYKVTHRVYGNGIVTAINDGYIKVKFATEQKTFLAKGFDKFFTIYDSELQKIVDEANKEAVTSSPVPSTPSHTSNTISSSRTTFSHSTTLRTASSLLGPRSQTIPIRNEQQMYELVGYMARPGRIGSIEAEVPMDGRDDLFEELFPGQIYRPITMGDTPSGMPNKLSPQFRINFSNLRNCPQILRENMGAGNASCVGRINKSKFVLTLVERYGFKFGDTQNISEIRKLAIDRGYQAEFERGYAL